MPNKLKIKKKEKFFLTKYTLFLERQGIHLLKKIRTFTASFAFSLDLMSSEGFWVN
jgi:hypothetical protein